MLLIIDNYDSFVHNLARYCRVAGWHDQTLIRNDAMSVKDIKALRPTSIIISPGPYAPENAGICVDVIKVLSSTTPILGVCLGHQCIGHAFGHNTVAAARPLHGQATSLEHTGQEIFKNINTPTEVGRYHSLVVDPKIDKDKSFIVTARTPQGDIMAIRHSVHPVYGVQFHPESILTTHGMQMIENFKYLSDAWWAHT